jgi:hypothetical protein
MRPSAYKHDRQGPYIWPLMKKPRSILDISLIRSVMRSMFFFLFVNNWVTSHLKSTKKIKIKQIKQTKLYLFDSGGPNLDFVRDRTLAGPLNRVIGKPGVRSGLIGPLSCINKIKNKIKTNFQGIF